MQTTDNTTALPPRVMIGHVIRAVCIECKVSKADLIGPRKHWALVRPRQIGMVVSKELTGASLPAIGNAFGRDHTTVLSSLRRIEDLLRVDKRLRADIVAVRARAIALAGGQPPPPSVMPLPPVLSVTAGDLAAALPKPRDLTPIEVAEANRLKLAGWSVFGLARRYDVPVELVCDAVGEREWKRAAA